MVFEFGYRLEVHALVVGREPDGVLLIYGGELGGQGVFAALQFDDPPQHAPRLLVCAFGLLSQLDDRRTGLREPRLDLPTADAVAGLLCLQLFWKVSANRAMRSGRRRLRRNPASTRSSSSAPVM